MPAVCAVVTTLAALGVVFLFLLALNAWDGFTTWRKWRAFVRLTAALPTVVEALAKHAGHARNDAPGDDVPDADQIPVPPCQREDCPRRARSA